MCVLLISVQETGLLLFHVHKKCTTGLYLQFNDGSVEESFSKFQRCWIISFLAKIAKTFF